MRTMEHPTKEGVESTEVLVENSKKWPQYLAASLATLFAVCVGTVDGWTSPALPYLQEPRLVKELNSTNTSYYHMITDDEASWIGSLAPLGALIGAIPAGYLSNILGRRKLLLILTFPLLLGWLIIIIAQDSVPLLYAARFILGIACGAATVATPLYNEEIAEVSIRGTLGVNMDMMFNVGILYIYVIGAFDSYFWLSISACIIPAIFAVTFFWMPESPIFLLSKGENEKAEESLRWLRGVGKMKSVDIERELNQMQKFVNDFTLSRRAKPITEKTNCRVFNMCMGDTSTKSATAKAVKIIFGLMIFQQMTGIDAVIYYTVDIFNDAGSSLSPFVCTIIVGILQLISTYIPSLVVDRAGRRILLILSELGMAVSLLVLSLHFTMQSNHVDTAWSGWIPLIAVNTFIIAFSIGFGPLPWLIMAELLSTEAKVWVSSMAVCLNWSLTFAVTKLFPIINRDLGPAMTYGMFCFVCILGTIFVILFVPETQGKSREDIQLELIGK